MKPKATNFPYYKPHHEEEKAKLETFIKSFSDSDLDDRIHGKKKYMIELVNKKKIKFKKYKIFKMQIKI